MTTTAQASERAASRIRNLDKPTHADYERIINEEYEKEDNDMATLINRRMFWALNHKIVPCFVVAHNLETATVTLLFNYYEREQRQRRYELRLRRFLRHHQQWRLTVRLCRSHSHKAGCCIYSPCAIRRRLSLAEAQSAGTCQRFSLRLTSPVPARDAGTQLARHRVLDFH